jgi:hypothetical protein
MSKFRAMALKVEDGSPSPLASTSSITLEDHPSTSPSKVYVDSDLVKMCDYPISTHEVRPSPVPSDDVKMEDSVRRDMKHSPNAKDFIPTKTEPSASTSSSTSPKPESTPPAQRKPLRKGPQLIGNLPAAREEAMKTFIEIQENQYQYSTLGRSREALESMTCECPPSGFGEFTPVFYRLCGWGRCAEGRPDEICVEDCINRLTQVECLPDDCKGGTFCMNQRCVAAPRIVHHSSDTEQGSNGGNTRKSISSRRRKRGSGFERRRTCQGTLEYLRVVRSDPNAGKGIHSFTSMSATSSRIRRLSSGCEIMRKKASSISTL